MYKIISTTDGKFIGETLATDLVHGELPNGDKVEFTNRLKTMEGVWRLWNANYIIEVIEVEEV